MMEELIEPKNNQTTDSTSEEGADTLGLRAAVQTNGLQVLEVTTHQLHLLPLWVHCAEEPES